MKMTEKNKKAREKKQPTFLLAVLPVIAMILLLGIGYAILGLSAEQSVWDIHGMRL